MTSKKDVQIKSNGRASVIIIDSRNPRWNQYIEVSATIDTNKMILERAWKSKKIKFNYRLMRSESDNLANWQGEEHAIRYFGQDVIKKAQRAVKANFKAILSEIESGKNHPIYNEMVKIVESTIKSYKSDFYFHDTLRLNQNGLNPFLWIIRESGTWLLVGESGEIPIIDYAVKNNPDAKYYHYNGESLAEIPAQSAKNTFYTLQG